MTKPEGREPVRSDDRFDMIVGLVREERERQDIKWGADRDQGDGRWMLIAIEEVGEAAEASLEGNNRSVVRELTQAAAVLFAWLDNRIYDLLKHEEALRVVSERAADEPDYIRHGIDIPYECEKLIGGGHG